jgi:uncharacterized protein (DUF1697 family)
MKYVALLRGINVGGNSIIKMTDLKSAVEKSGFRNVKTYIQSGNVIFESEEKNTAKITSRLEEALLKNFQVETRVILLTPSQLKKVISEIPGDWKNNNDIRRYVAFIREPVTAQDVMREIELREGVDFVKPGEGVVYLSTLLSGLTKSKLNKIMAKKVYRDITIRNYNTVQKLLAFME